jgi:hypothetical protein
LFFGYLAEAELQLGKVLFFKKGIYISVALFFGYLAEAELQLGKVLFFKKVV